jgi:apolipoprotein N-acyltransferase
MQQKMKAFFNEYQWALLTGVMIGTTYIPFPPWALFFCFVPLWLYWLQNANNLKKILLSGWISQFVLTLIGFNWVAHTLKEFGHLPWPAAVIGLMVFCSFASLHVPLGGALWYWLNRRFQLRGLSQILALPFGIALFEHSYPMIFDWHFGYTWYWANFPAIHTAEIWGVKFLSTLSITLNIVSLLVWQNRRSPKKYLTSLALGLAVLLGVNVLGAWLKSRLVETDKSARVLVAQANIGNLEKQYAEKGLGFREHIVREYLDLTEGGIKQNPEAPIDFAIWPETAFPDRLSPHEIPSGLSLRLKRFVNDQNVPLITGGYGTELKTGRVSNSLFVLDTNGNVQTPVYSKTVLLAFGEYIPGGQWFPQIYDLLPQVAHFARGDGAITQTLGSIVLGPQICYEGLFDWFSRDSARLGSQILVNVTNDSWYGTWQQPYQHLYMTLSRAIETRLPLIRSTNTGISTVVLASGEILNPSPLHEKWSYVYEIPYHSQPSLTFFSKWGYWWTYTFLLLWGVFIFAASRSQHD